MQKRNTSDLLLSTPQWSAVCAAEKNIDKKQLPDFIIDKREIVVDPVSKKKFYVCKMTSDREIYYEVKNKLMR